MYDYWFNPDWIKPKPEYKCPYCKGAASIRNGAVVYNGNSKYGSVLVCDRYPKCDSYVSCHPGTDKPAGKIAGPALRKLRKECHEAFESIWKTGLLGTRPEAYRWLAREMKLGKFRANIGGMTYSQCKQAMEIIERWKAERQPRPKQIH